MADLVFDLAVEPGPDAARVALHGELDLGSAGRLERALAEHPGPLVLDLRGLTFMDSTGVRILLEAADTARSENRFLEVLPPAGGDARRTIDETGIAALLPLVEESSR